jgi:hypothetical protein
MGETFPLLMRRRPFCGAGRLIGPHAIYMIRAAVWRVQIPYLEI